MATSPMSSNAKGGGGAARRSDRRSVVRSAALSMVLLAGVAAALTPALAAAAPEPSPPSEPTPATETSVLVPEVPSVVFAANAECDPEAGQTTVVWKATNNGSAPVQITNLTEPVRLDPNPVPPGATARGTRVIDGPATDAEVTGTVTLDASGIVFELSDGITAPHCEGPGLPPELTFAFSAEPTVSEASVGDTVRYRYCAENTSTIPLEIVELSDDRLGVLAVGSVVVVPGGTLCHPLQQVRYVVESADAGSVIDSNGVLTLRTQEDPPREFQVTAQASVTVLAGLDAGAAQVTSSTR